MQWGFAIGWPRGGDRGGWVLVSRRRGAGGQRRARPRQQRAPDARPVHRGLLHKPVRRGRAHAREPMSPVPRAPRNADTAARAHKPEGRHAGPHARQIGVHCGDTASRKSN